jgi:hypothetical protein
VLVLRMVETDRQAGERNVLAVCQHTVLVERHLAEFADKGPAPRPAQRGDPSLDGAHPLPVPELRAIQLCVGGVAFLPRLPVQGAGLSAGAVEIVTGIGVIRAEGVVPAAGIAGPTPSDVGGGSHGQHNQHADQIPQRPSSAILCRLHIQRVALSVKV